MTSLQLNDREKALFQDWLFEREKVIMDELEVLKSLHKKLQTNTETKNVITQEVELKTTQKHNAAKKDDNSLSWITIIKNELKHFSSPVPSGEIVKRLLYKPALSEKGKRFITKAVTSKLWLLQERGEVSKTREDGKYVYSLKQ